MIIEIPGRPIPLQRPRMYKKGLYDPQYMAKKNFASIVKIKTLNRKELPIKDYLYLELNFFFKFPKSWSKKKKNFAFLNPVHTSKPDLSNLIKFVEDALNDVLWSDDCVIYKIKASKHWHDEDLTVIKIR